MTQATDRELLEAAARAAGIFLTPEMMRAALPKWEWSADFDPFHNESGGMTGTVLWYGSDGVEIGGTESYDWNPLIDDGDAFRLAVKLRLDIEFEGGKAVFADGNFSEFTRNDPCAATRRAIVRAAAAVGGMGGDGEP